LVPRAISPGLKRMGPLVTADVKITGALR
jgi:hypothetical protein